MYRCDFCGYSSNVLSDFEEDFIHSKGFWCPYCDGFTYLEKNNDNHKFRLIFEVKNKNTALNKKGKRLPFRTQVSPLRWPGGKSRFIGQVLDRCNPENMVNFIEPFAGGASVGLSLLLAGKVEDLYLNDLDYGVYSLFQTIKLFPDALILRVKEFIPSKQAYKYSQSIVNNKYEKLDIIDAAWNLLVVNRLAFSGIPKANCMSDAAARWNPKTLSRKIQDIHALSEHIHVSCMDACEYIEEMYWRPQSTIFIDPPYKEKGSALYMEYYNDEDHERLALLLDELYKGMPGADMLLTYDDSDFIRELYRFPCTEDVARVYSIAN